MQQPLSRHQHVFCAHNRLDEHGLRAISRGRDHRYERLWSSPEGLIETMEKAAVETRSKRRARLVHHLADAAKAKAAEER